MSMRTRILVGIAATAVALTSCGAGDDDASPAPSPAASPDGEWVAVAGVSDGSEVELVEGFAITIGIEEDQVVGISACNRYSGAVQVGDDGSFAASGLSWTEIGCEPAVLEVEQAYLTSLGEFTHYAVGDGSLTLSSESDEWVFTPSAPAGS